MEIAGAGLAGIAATFWVRRWNWHYVARFSLGALVIGNSLSAFVENYELLVALRFLTGLLGMGTGYALAAAALSHTEKTVRNYSFTVILQVITAILGFTILPTIIAKFGTSAVFIPLGGMPILLLPFVRLLPVQGIKQKSEQTNKTGQPSAAIWLAIGCTAIWYLGIGGVWAFVERMGVEAGLDTIAVGQGLAVGMAGSLIGAFLAAMITDRFGRIIPFVLGMLGQLVGLWYLAQLHHLNDLIIAILLFNGTWNFAVPYIFAVAAKADTHGQLVVLIPTAQAGGISFGATLAGVITGGFGLVAVTYQGAAAALAALAMFIVAVTILRKES